MSEKYDSTAETLKHIRKVNEHILVFNQEMLRRAVVHDNSKLESPEKEIFDKFTPELEKVKYGSDEYKALLKKIAPALEHHYKHNSHHPEATARGIDGMDLFDVVEMFCDWLAATERTKEGNIFLSLEINKSRFKMSDQLYNILFNTAKKFKNK